MKKKNFILMSVLMSVYACGSNDEAASLSNVDVVDDNPMEVIENDEQTETEGTEEDVQVQEFKILALGDSYTIGQSVCETCRFPEQLKESLINTISDSNFTLDIIAQTGWTTTALKNTISSQNPASKYDLVTLLIGVNNQYQHKPFSLYETEFPELLNTAITLVKADKNNVIVISIPDYAYTPFGQNSLNPEQISEELDAYNNFAETYSNEREVTFVYITDITREGLNNPDLVASDGLHPSELAYSLFVARLLPISLEKLQ